MTYEEYQKAQIARAKSRADHKATMIDYRIREFQRIGSGLAAYEMLWEMGRYADLKEKMERLIRRHRMLVWDSRTGDAHSRAIHRLKCTVTALAVSFDREAGRQVRVGQALSAMGY